MFLRNDAISVEFNEINGVLTALRRARDGMLLAAGSADGPFILETSQDVYTSAFERFEYEQRDNVLHLKWRLPDGIEVRAQASLDNATLSFTSSVENRSPHRLHSLEYPIIDGLKTFGDGCHQAVHSFAAGLLVDNPLDVFEKDGGGFRYMPYPESFSGASMQFFGYYRKDAEGLYFEARDGQCHQKWLNFYARHGALRASQIYGYEDVAPGKGLCASWPFSVTYVENATWESLAERYRGWALNQDWCRKGRLADRNESETARWLVENTAAVTFGINACHDRTRWLKKYRADVGGPMFHILGPDWPKVDQTFGRGVPGGIDDWFPTRFNRENIDVMREQGDRFAPFEFDFLLHTDKSDGDTIRENLQVWPKTPKSVDKYRFTMVCPLTEYTRALHVTRDVRVAEESGCDGMYYDISANNILKTCLSEKHGHPAGAGREMTYAYRRIYTETKNAMEQATGRYMPIGTEMINETLIAEIDYYQARANAQPNSALETWPFRKLVRNGLARVVPLFQYVYGGYGPVRCDGWGKLTRENGDMVYHTIAKTYLWGGLFEINLEYSEMERLDGESNPSAEHFYHFEPTGFAYDESVAAFIGRCAKLRTGKHGKPMIYGRMVKTPEVQCRALHRTYFMYNHSTQSGEQGDRGILALDAVLAQAYELDGMRILYAVNTSLYEETASVRLPDTWNDGGADWTAAAGDGAEEPAAVAEGTLRLTLAPLETFVLYTRRT